jgi:hypothetical protein
MCTILAIMHLYESLPHDPKPSNFPDSPTGAPRSMMNRAFCKQGYKDAVHEIDSALGLIRDYWTSVSDRVSYSWFL